jgi:hypothetical protein
MNDANLAQVEEKRQAHKPVLIVLPFLRPVLEFLQGFHVLLYIFTAAVPQPFAFLVVI